MPSNPVPTLPIKHGTANSVAIVGQANSATFAVQKFVTLTTSYSRERPPGSPDPAPGQEVGKSWTTYPQTIASGTRLFCTAMRPMR
jgi:hypothetical protein